METRFIEHAISMLERSRTRLTSVARHSDDWMFLQDIDSTVREARAEISSIHRGPRLIERAHYDPPEPPVDGCFCNATNAPCRWCETHCPDCSEDDDECTCESSP